jgi:hypothetical protein
VRAAAPAIGSDFQSAIDPGLATGLFASAAAYDVFTEFVTYFAPMWIAVLRGHPEARWIGALNALFGWTVIGWLIAIVWAFSRLPDREPIFPAPAMRR